MYTKRSAAEFLDKLLGGGQAAYAELVQCYQRLVCTLVVRVSKHRDDAEDVAQDSLVKAYRSLHTFKRTAKFSTWMYSIVYTTAMTFLRKKKPEFASIDDESTMLTVHNVSEYETDKVSLKS